MASFELPRFVILKMVSLSCSSVQLFSHWLTDQTSIPWKI